MLLNDSNSLKDEVNYQMSVLRGEHKSERPNRHTQERLRGIKDKVKIEVGRVKGFVRALNLMLDEDEDLALMNLSRLVTNPERFVLPLNPEWLNEESDEPELILEAYLQQALSTVKSLDLIQGQIATTEELVQMKLDTVRNRLLLINTVLGLITLSVSVASLIGSIFGMNLINHLEDDEDAFLKVVFWTIMSSFLLLMFLSFIFWRVSTWVLH